jgi:AcrR family transcriptional regulator
MVHALMGLYIELAFESDLEQVPLDVDRTADQLVRMFAPRHHADPAGEAGTPATRAAATDESPGPDPARAENADPDDDESARGRLSRAQRRESILVAARALFLEAGLSGARSKDLADRAQITEGFLYQHFSSKEEIYELAVEVPTEQALIELAADIERICQGEHGSTFLQALNERCLRFFVDHGATLTTALLSDLERSRRFYRERVAVHFDGVGAAIAAKMGYDADVIDPELARRAIMGCQWGVSIALRTRYPTSDLSAIARHLTRLFISGVKGGMAAPHGAHMVADQLSG